MGEAGRTGREGLRGVERQMMRDGEEEETGLDLWQGAGGVEGTRPGEFGQQPRDPAVLENLLAQEQAQFKGLMDNLLNENSIVKAQYDKARNSALGSATDEETSKRLWAKQKAVLEAKLGEQKTFIEEQMRTEQEKNAEVVHQLRSQLEMQQQMGKEHEELRKELSRAHQTAVEALKGQLEATMRRLNGLLTAKTVTAGAKALAASQTTGQDPSAGKELQGEANGEAPDGGTASARNKEKKEAKKARNKEGKFKDAKD